MGASRVVIGRWGRSVLVVIGSSGSYFVAGGGVDRFVVGVGQAVGGRAGGGCLQVE